MEPTREDAGDADPGRGPAGLASGKATVRTPTAPEEVPEADRATSSPPAPGSGRRPPPGCRARPCCW
ncbi:hypothetical protein [Streptomyces sp. NPDC016626]|uniref:hypothetical protein n=1 Tax=Streptomyces sp. NPDC016626 TaxID=3364968 RepID=UPI0036FEACD6